MDSEKRDIVSIYKQMFNVWESYMKAFDMVIWTPFLPGEQIGKFSELVVKLWTQYLEQMFVGSISPQRRDMDEVMERITTFERRISELASKIDRLEEAFDEILDKTRASKKI
jgi:hypothetical protein